MANNMPTAQLCPRGGSPCVALLGDDKGYNADDKQPTWRSRHFDQESFRCQKNKEELKVDFTKDSSNQDDPLNPAPPCDDNKLTFDFEEKK